MQKTTNLDKLNNIMITPVENLLDRRLVVFNRVFG